ncbi:hypothetical protein [Brassicibacter mesophilus]|uniref:hypothetical protein n=1 Tax=Brassicibacter mesophilus TaxID=745119 RepID=UPI003D1E5BE4
MHKSIKNTTIFGIICFLIAGIIYRCYSLSNKNLETVIIKEEYKKPQNINKIKSKNNFNDMNENEVNKRVIFSDTENMLYIENESLYLGYKDNNSKILIKKNICYDKMPQFNILYEDNHSKYIVVYYSIIYCGGPGQWIPFHIIRCDKKERNMEVVFEEDNILVGCKFDNEQLIILIQDSLEVVIDVNDVIKNLSECKKEELLTGKNISVANTCMLEIKDFKGNGTNQLMLRLWVKDYNLSLELGYIYLILEVDDDKIKIIKGFEADLNNEVINSIGENTYYYISKENKDEGIQQLTNKGIVKEQDGRIQLFFEE